MFRPAMGLFRPGAGRASSRSKLAAPTQPDPKPPKIRGADRIAHEHHPFAAAPSLIEPQDYECRRNKMLAAEPAFMPSAVTIPPGSASVLSQLERHRRTGRPVQDFGKAAGTREEDAETDQNLRPAGQGHPDCPERKNMGDDKQARELERGLEIELDQTRLKISVPLVPPNPKEFDRAERSGMRRAALGT